MSIKRIGLVGLVIGAGLAASACVDDYGYGVNAGYGAPYYDGAGYGDPYYGYGYGDGYYGGGYGSSYFGWYGDYYYPGTGIYVYDRYRHPYRWNDGQRRYWEGRRNNWRGDRNFRSDWNGFDRNRDGRDDGYRGNGYRGDRGNGYQGFQGNRDGQRFDGNRGYQSRGDRPRDGSITPRYFARPAPTGDSGVSGSFNNRGAGASGGFGGNRGGFGGDRSGGRHGR